MVVRLEWGGLSLVKESYSAASAFSIDAMAEGTGFGNPQAVVTAVRSRLQNGSLASVTSFDNRQGSVLVVVESASFDGLAAGEAALMAQSSVDGYSTLVWSPDSLLARATVFDVVYTVMSFEFDDLEETRFRRTFRVEFFSLPFGREETLTTVAATTAPPVVTPVTTVVNDGALATGWTATNGSAPSSAGGLVSTTSVGTPQAEPMQLRRDSLLTTYAAGDLLVVEWKSGSRTEGSGEYAYVTILGYATLLTRVSKPVTSPGAPAAGYIRSWFTLPGTGDWPIKGVRFGLPGMLPGAVLAVDLVYVANGAGFGLTTVDDGSSATYWSSENGGPSAGAQLFNVTTAAGAVQATAVGSYAPRAVRLNLTTSVTVSATPLVYVDSSAASDVSELLVTTAGGVITAQKTASGLSPSGLARSFFRLTTNVTAISFGLPSAPQGTVLSIDQVVRTNVEPGSGTLRQRVRSLAIGGSAPTQASLVITAPSGQTLGRGTLIYTRTATTGFQPNLRPYLISSAAVTVDATMVSGSRNALGTAMVFRFPASKIKDAAHALVGLLRAGTAGSYVVTYSAKVTNAAGADVPESVVVTSGSTTLVMTADATLHTFLDVANLQLPTVSVAPDSDRTITLTINGPAAVIVDDFYLLDLDNGVLSLLDTDTLTRLEVRTPSLTSPEESVWGGYAAAGAATGLVRQDYRLRSLGQHVFPPGVVDAFTVTTGTDGSALSAMFYRSFFANVGAPPT